MYHDVHVQKIMRNSDAQINWQWPLGMRNQSVGRKTNIQEWETTKKAEWQQENLYDAEAVLRKSNDERFCGLLTCQLQQEIFPKFILIPLDCQNEINLVTRNSGHHESGCFIQRMEEKNTSSFHPNQ